MRHLLRLLLVVMLCGAACGSPTKPSDPGGGTTLPNGSMSALIDGVAWNATVAIVVLNTSTGGIPIISISGGDPVRSIAFAASPTGIGTFTVASLTMSSNFGLVQGNQRWSASTTDAGSNGTVTFTTLTANRAAGTFSFLGIASASSAATGTRTITNGVFNVTF